MTTTVDSTAFRAISHPIRRDILEMLAGGERTVGDLRERFKVSQPAVSQHLETLREAGLVRARAQGRHRLYALEPAPLREVFDWAARFELFWADRLDRLGAVLDREAQWESATDAQRESATDARRAPATDAQRALARTPARAPGRAR